MAVSKESTAQISARVTVSPGRLGQDGINERRAALGLMQQEATQAWKTGKKERTSGGANGNQEFV